MNDEAPTGATSQDPPVIIENSATTPPSYFSEKVGRDFGSPTGGWVVEQARATRMSQDKADELLAGPLQFVAASCKAVTP